MTGKKKETSESYSPVKRGDNPLLGDKVAWVKDGSQMFVLAEFYPTIGTDVACRIVGLMNKGVYSVGLDSLRTYGPSSEEERRTAAEVMKTYPRPFFLNGKHELPHTTKSEQRRRKKGLGPSKDQKIRDLEHAMTLKQAENLELRNTVANIRTTMFNLEKSVGKFTSDNGKLQKELLDTRIRLAKKLASVQLAHEILRGSYEDLHKRFCDARARRAEYDLLRAEHDPVLKDILSFIESGEGSLSLGTLATRHGVSIYRVIQTAKECGLDTGAAEKDLNKEPTSYAKKMEFEFEKDLADQVAQEITKDEDKKVVASLDKLFFTLKDKQE